MADYMIYMAYFVTGFFFWLVFVHTWIPFFIDSEYITPVLLCLLFSIFVMFGLAYLAKQLGNIGFFGVFFIGGTSSVVFEICYRDYKKWKALKEKKMEDEGAKAGLSES